MSGSIEKTISGFALPGDVVNAIEEDIPGEANFISVDAVDGDIYWWKNEPENNDNEFLPNDLDITNGLFGKLGSLNGEGEGLLYSRRTLPGESSNAPKPCYVKWIDAVHCDGQGWKELDQFEPVPAECYSVGFIVHEDDSILVLAATVDMHEGFFTHYCSEISIPKVCILERKEL